MTVEPVGRGHSRVRQPAIDPQGPALAVVIPTSNRASLAIAACRSLLAQDGVQLEVFVSDNSTRGDESAVLARFCREAADPRLTYLRPDGHLAMPTHWDWAMGQALERSQASHLMVHYDRKITKPGQLRGLCRIAADVPDRLITYAVDHITDRPHPSTLWQVPWTGRVYAVRTARVVEMTASADINGMGHVFPIFSNCVVPRAVLLGIREHFGTICDSTGPDSCFTYRFAALHDSFVCCDRAVGIVYAPQRSNGLGYLRQSGGDFPDFVADWGDRPWLDAAPIPGLNLGQNMLFHEYELVRREVDPPRFPPIDLGKYLASLEASLSYIDDEQIRRRMRAVLEQHGLPPVEAAPATARPEGPQRRPRGARMASRLASRARTGWHQLRRRPTMLRLSTYAGLQPEHITGVSFASDEQALYYGVRVPRRPVETHQYLEAMQVEPITRVPMTC